jgi:hypothetical protein
MNTISNIPHSEGKVTLKDGEIDCLVVDRQLPVFYDAEEDYRQTMPQVGYTDSPEKRTKKKMKYYMKLNMIILKPVPY